MGTFTPGDAQDLLASYKRAWERRDVDLAVSLFAPDAEFRADPFAAPLSGANAIRAWWNVTVAGIDHVELDVERTWVAGETVLASFHGAWTERATAQRIRTRGFLTAELGAERLIERLRLWPRTMAVGTDATLQAEGSAAPVAGRGGRGGR
jgi:ketosteroid isomerase-like protein